MSYYLRGFYGFGDLIAPVTLENCDPLDSACVARNLVASNAHDVAVAQAQAQNNIDQCMANAANATPGAQYDAAVAACNGQYSSQSPTGQAPATVNWPSNFSNSEGGAQGGTQSGSGGATVPVLPVVYASPVAAKVPVDLSGSTAVSPAITTTTGGTSTEFDISSIPAWGWLAIAAGVALFAFGGGRGR